MGRYLVDQMCGRLARYLRFCGHDAVYAGDRSLEYDSAILATAREESRVIISRDRHLCERAVAAISLESREIEGQLREVARAGVTLELPEEPTRCGRCNGELSRRPEHATEPPYVPDDWKEPTYRCRECGQVFWTGSHWNRVAATLERVRDTLEN